jgi:DNA-binding GntR family transcriptional regulator
VEKNPALQPVPVGRAADLSFGDGKVKRLSLSDQAYIAIKDAILNITLPPGTVITEDHLANQLGISKSPVRAALVHLQRDGLVVFSPYKGTIVSELREKDVRDLYEVRALLEPYCVRRLTPVLTDRDVETVQDLLDRAEAALSEGDNEVFSRHSSDFHSYIVNRLGNATIIASYNSISLQMERLRHISRDGHPGRRQTLEEEKEIFSYMKANEADKAAALMERHILQYLELFVEAIHNHRIEAIQH